MVIIKSHTYRIRSVSETATGGVVYSAESADRYGLLTPASQTSIYQQWGLELRNPFVLFAESTDTTGVKPGDRITAHGHVFTVVGVERRDVDDAAEHTKLLLERLDYA